MNFYAQNIESATLTLTSGTAHASYPLTNLNSLVRNKTFRTAAASAAPVIKIDLGSARACDYIALGGKNYDASTYTLSYGIADNGTDFDVDISEETLTVAEDEVWAFSSTTKRYWRLYLDAFANNAADYIGLIFLGSSYSTPINPEYNNIIGYNYDNVVSVENNSYQQRYQIQNRRFNENYSIRGFNQAQMEAFIAEFEDNCSGTLKPFFFTRDDSSATLSYAHFASNPFMFRKITKDYYETNIEIIQQL